MPLMDVSCSSSKEAVEIPWCWSALGKEVTSWESCLLSGPRTSPQQFQVMRQILTPLWQQDEHLQNEKQRCQQPVNHVSNPNSSDNFINLNLTLKFNPVMFHR